MSPLFYDWFKTNGNAGKEIARTQTYVLVDFTNKQIDAVNKCASLLSNPKSEEAKERPDLHRASRRVLRSLSRAGLE